MNVIFIFYEESVWVAGPGLRCSGWLLSHYVVARVLFFYLLEIKNHVEGRKKVGRKEAWKEGRKWGGRKLGERKYGKKEVRKNGRKW